MNERNTKSNPHELECIALDEPQPVDDLADLDVGDRVLIDDRRRPLTVVEIGTRVKGDEKINKEVRVPIVRLKGHWAGAIEIDLTHQLDRTPILQCDGSYVQRLDVNDKIVDMELGREKNVRRTHVVGAAGRAAGNGQEVRV